MVSEWPFTRCPWNKLLSLIFFQEGGLGHPLVIFRRNSPLPMKKQYQIPVTEAWRLEVEDAVLTGISRQTNTSETYRDEEEYGGF